MMPTPQMTLDFAMYLMKIIIDSHKRGIQRNKLIK